MDKFDFYPVAGTVTGIINLTAAVDEITTIATAIATVFMAIVTVRNLVRAAYHKLKNGNEEDNNHD